MIVDVFKMANLQGLYFLLTFAAQSSGSDSNPYLEYQGFGTRYRERKRLPAFAVLAFAKVRTVKGLSEPPNQRGYEGKRPSRQRCSLPFAGSVETSGKF